MSSPVSRADQGESLAKRILRELENCPAQKASQIAAKLGVDRRDVNRCLSHVLAGKVQQDAGYRWRLRELGTANAGNKRDPEGSSASELARLCRYYLECIGQDSDRGVSVFAASQYSDPDYAELPAAPLGGLEWDWWNAPRAASVLNKVRIDRGRLVAWLGYPVRLRLHRTAKWEGFFVEPVLLWPIVLPETPGDAYRLQDELPTLNFAFLRSLAMGDPSQIVEEAARLGTELGLNNPLHDQPEPDELLQRLFNIRPDWDWREPLDPTDCPNDPSLSQLAEPGIYNRAVIVPGERSPYTQGLESELKSLADKPESELTGTVLGSWLSSESPVRSITDVGPLLEVLPMNLEQRSAVESALTASLTVVTGPPGTGKSQVVTNLLVNAAWRGMKVLFASKNNKAVDVVEARVNGLGNRPVLLRLGSKEYQAKLGSYLTAMLSGAASKDDEASYQEGLQRHRQFLQRLAQLDESQASTLAIRNQVDQLDAQADDYRILFGETRFNTLDEKLLQAVGAVDVLIAATNALDPTTQSALGRMVARLFRNAKLRTLRKVQADLR